MTISATAAEVNTNLESEIKLTYDITANGAHEISAKKGDIITVTFKALRTDKNEQHHITAIQNEMVYDQSVLEYVDDSITTVNGTSQWMTRTTGEHIIQWFNMSADLQADQTVCTFQLKVIASGVSGVVSSSKEKGFDYDYTGIEITQSNLTVQVESEDSSNNSGNNNNGNTGTSSGTSNAVGGQKTEQEAIVQAEVPLAEYVNPYADVKESDWFYAAVMDMGARGWFNGVGNNLFQPDGDMTRAMFAQVLFNIAGADASAYTTCRFEDVDDNMWYTAAVEWGASKGVILGVSPTKFAPDAMLTREQMVVLLYRYFNAEGLTISGEGQAMESFADSASVSDWAAEGMQWATERGVIKGTDTGLAPLKATSRAEAAQFISNLWNAIETPTDDTEQETSG
ncbi:MAG: S-layer homology domain-containing protein [Oscillospiraceae bacterium]|nr:S-layer homology domain-containing protein [Oscillospiraceae bacterium]